MSGLLAVCKIADHVRGASFVIPTTSGPKPFAGRPEFPEWGHAASRGVIREQGVVSGGWLGSPPSYGRLSSGRLPREPALSLSRGGANLKGFERGVTGGADAVGIQKFPPRE